jgi:DNA-binding NarL/FixJ family response regulator
MKKLIKLGIVEDQDLFRAGMKAVLRTWSELKFVFESPEGFSILERLHVSATIPDVMLVDMILPNHGREEFNGMQVVQVLKEHYPAMKILILSALEDSYLIVKLIEAGANGYLIKDSSPQEVHDAIVAVYEKGSYINGRSLLAIQSKLRGKMKTPKRHEALTKREIEVLRLICEQKTAEEIGEALFISKKTVNGHRNNLLQKTGARNISGLVMYAIKHNIVEAV